MCMIQPVRNNWIFPVMIGNQLHERVINIQASLTGFVKTNS